MSDALVVRVRFYEGRYHGAGGWPPAPARLFQALVAGAATGWRIAPADREALAWMEEQGAPLILAPAASRGQGFNTYVPNNDLDAVSGIETVAGDPAGYIRRKGGWEIAASSIRAAKSIRPWLFDAAQPVTYLWPTVTDEPLRARMVALADRLYQFGRGIDPAWAEARPLDTDEAEKLIAAHDGPVWRPTAPGPDGLAVPMRGSLASLETRHAAFLRRFRQIGTGRGTQTTFTNPPKPRFRQIRYGAPSQILLFDLRTPDGRFLAVPAAEAAPLVRRLIERAAARLTTALPAEAARIERFLIGRGAGPTDSHRRVRVFAVPTLRRHVDRAIRRVAVEIPADCPLRAADVGWAFAGLSPRTGDPDSESGASILVGSDDRSMFDRYCGTARLWRSETPLALPAASRRRIGSAAPRQPESGAERFQQDNTAALAVVSALRHAGLRERPLSIRVQREPFAAPGTRAEAFAAGTRFPRHALWHVEIGFARSVPGPLILGDGRFCGLGLMRPQERAPGAFAFALESGPERMGPEALAGALRRAVMARVRDVTGSRELAPWFTGHGPGSGDPLRDGTHRHLAFAADPDRRRLLIIPPHLIERGAPAREDRDRLYVLERAVADLSVLWVGQSDPIRLRPTGIDDDDPLFAAATSWRTLTLYRPTRHPKRDREAAIAEDIRTEAARRGLPRPEVRLLDIERGPRGGLAVHVRLCFARVVAGPVLLGRTLHKGGGLFVGEREGG